ncbi:MAG: redox-sensing transcriptional repressor Rex [Lentisphaerae bacterium]|nr:MAG: redox-sensing transcriptional repressor Rex [Lentisphaerota bacterium]
MKSGLPSRAAVNRMISYLRLMEELLEDGVEWVSSSEIATALGITSSSVRQDLTWLDFSGVPKSGYNTHELHNALRSFLKADCQYNVILIGAGNLGRALASHEGFRRDGYHIEAIFDTKPELIGQSIGDVPIYHFKDLDDLVHKHGWRLAIIAVPPAAAQAVGESLVRAGICGILNLSAKHLHLPSHVTVVDVRLIGALRELTFSLHRKGCRCQIQKMN